MTQIGLFVPFRGWVAEHPPGAPRCPAWLSGSTHAGKSGAATKVTT